MDITDKVGLFFGVSIGQLDGKQTICIASVKSPGDTILTWCSPENARKMAKHLVEMADLLEPPPKQWQVADSGDGKLVAKLGEAPSSADLAKVASSIIQDIRARGRKTKKRR